MDCATISSDVIGDFQEPYRAVLVDGRDIAALPSNRLRLLVATGAAQPARKSGSSRAHYKARRVIAHRQSLRRDAQPVARISLVLKRASASRSSDPSPRPSGNRAFDEYREE